MDNQAGLGKSEYVYLALGCLGAVLLLLPWLLLGEDSIVVYHDQLDGELLTYLLNAKHLFEGMDTFPEIMKGIPAAGLTMPAPGFVFLFCIFRPFTALMIMQFTVNITAFLSMYFLLRELTGHKLSAALGAGLFMMLPFYPVYGLCIPGQPCFWLALLKLSQNGSRKWFYYILLGVYAAFSSLALVGFACLLTAGIYGVFLLIKAFMIKETDKKKQRRNAAFRIFGAVVSLGTVYVLCNGNLVKQLIAPEGAFISHKSEVVYREIPFVRGVTDCLFRGVDYAQSGQVPIIILSGAALLTGVLVFFLKKNDLKTEWKKFWKHSAGRIGILYGLLVVIALFYGVYHGSVVTEIRNEAAGVFHDFNLDRVAWLMPVLWYAIAACSLDVFIGLWTKIFSGLRRRTGKYIAGISLFTAVFGICAVMFINLFWGHGVKPNVAKLIKGEENYTALSWKQFWAEDLFAQVEAVIGEPKEDYYVVSYGIYPAAAAFNGFYCLDGYSNNYDVEYKHEFRNVIAPELAKSEYLTEWYDEWGNRCYIVTIEKNNYFTFDKQTSAVAMTFDVDVQALKELGCDYLISAAYIMNFEENGAKLLTPEGIETGESWYRLFVYKIQ